MQNKIIHPLEDLKLKANLALKNSRLVEIVKKASTPSLAQRVSDNEGFSKELTRSCHSLALIKRDYPFSFKVILVKNFFMK